MKHYELIPEYNRQKSFYKKAHVTEYSKNYSILTSYKTEVAAIQGKTFFRLWDDYSVTTLNHVNEYRQQNGLDSISKKEWLEIPVSGNQIINIIASVREAS